MVKLQMFEVMCVKAWFCQKASAGFVKSGHSFSWFMPYFVPQWILDQYIAVPLLAAEFICDQVWQKGSYRPWQEMQFFTQIQSYMNALLDFSVRHGLW